MSDYTVTDPAGVVHTRKRGARKYTHALIRQNKDGNQNRYFVNWASSLANAEKEARVYASSRSYIAIVEIQ
jgi:hypothetical protein